jgi:hypothetical protein
LAVAPSTCRHRKKKPQESNEKKKMTMNQNGMKRLPCDQERQEDDQGRP